MIDDGDSCAHEPCRQTLPDESAQRATLSTLIIGGFTMQPKHLLKYQRLYREQGIDRVELVTPSLLSMTVPRLADWQARRMLRQLESQQSPLVLHLFSGAVWIYFALNEFASDAVRRRIRAVVFESTPLDVQPEQFGRFLSWKLGQPYRPAWSYPFIPYRLLVGISPVWEKRNQRNMLALPTELKTLFVYSRSDVIAASSYIEQYSQSLRERGLDVTVVPLNDARHCQAIRDECDRYREAIGSFLSRL